MIDRSVVAAAISQSGENFDTLAALREAKARDAMTLAVCNMLGAALPREAGNVLYRHAGPEIGVASTKAFTTQLVLLALLAVELALVGTLGGEDGHRWLNQLLELPTAVEAALKDENHVLEEAKWLVDARDVLFLGRGAQAASAYEGV